MGVVEEVIALYADYAWAVDDCDLEALRGLLTENVRLNANDWLADGVDRFIETYTPLLAKPPATSRHFISNVRAEMNRDGTIQTGAYFHAVFHEPTRSRIQTGRYRDVLVVTSSGLRIAHKQIEVDPALTASRASGSVSRGATA